MDDLLEAVGKRVSVLRKRQSSVHYSRIAAQPFDEAAGRIPELSIGKRFSQ
jgi:hypothetical protein